MADSRNKSILTFVFTKINSTGRDFEAQPFSITEIFMSAILREHIETDSEQPEKIEFKTLVRPPVPLSLEAAAATALTLDDLATSPIFEDVIDQLNNYLAKLRKPICLVAHTGPSFDFRLLRIQTNSCSYFFSASEGAGKTLPQDLLKADFKVIFYNILKEEFQGTDDNTKIGQKIEDICAKLDVEFKERAVAKNWVSAMIACVMKRKKEFLKWVDDGKYSTPFNEVKKQTKRKMENKKTNEKKRRTTLEQ